MKVLLGFVLALILGLGSACSQGNSANLSDAQDALAEDQLGVDAPGDAGDALGQDGDSFVGGKGLGESCLEDGECLAGLECLGTVCKPSGDLDEGDPCVVSGQCGSGLICGPDLEDLEKLSTCVPEGPSTVGEFCATDRDCERGLYCVLLGFNGQCAAEGPGGLGDGCTSQADCQAGFGCSVESKCGLLGLDLPLFAGETCQSNGELGGAPRVLFEVPRGGQPLADFYRLPFPNDLRIVGGKVVLEGHPTPGPGIIGMDLPARLFEAAQQDLEAFGTNPVVYFRFSTDLHNPKYTIVSSGDDANILFVDVTDPLDDSYGGTRGLNWLYSPSRQKYVCQNSLAVYPPLSRPLAPGRKYAVILKNTLKAAPEEVGGQPRNLAQDADLQALLAPQAPQDTELAAVWPKYAPLRTFLASSKASQLGLSVANTVGATLFTTFDPRATARTLADYLKTKSAPAVVDLVLCEDGAVSPCDDGLSGAAHTRGCLGTSEQYYEFQGKARIPIFQEGTRPYLNPEDGGRVKVQNGQPLQTGEEEVCFSLTIPKGVVMPEEGWPVVVYSHGTGGDYRTHLTEGVAGHLASVNAWDPVNQTYHRPVALAVLGFDQVMHGPRRGASQLPPESLVFNFRNPRAALGNLFQGAADVASFVALARSLEISIGPYTEEAQGRLDPQQVAFMGHGIGAATGALYLPFAAADLQAAVLSSAGGGVADQLLRATTPVDLRDGLVLALQDDSVSRAHPVMAILQAYFEAVDPLNFGEAFFYTVEAEQTALPILHLYGLDDLQTAPATIRSLAQVMRTDLAMELNLNEELYDIYSGVQQISLPKTVSRGVTVEYGNDGTYTGGFVVFKNPEAIKHYKNFLGTSVLDAKPSIPQ
jgi:pimeloyl-ACP methyl ester carboxylesterase